MMNNVGSLMQMLSQMKQNPQKFLSQRFNKSNLASAIVLALLGL